MVASGAVAGYFPLRRRSGWDGRSFQPFAVAPSFGLADPELRLVDLDGDGVTDAIRSGARLECFFNDPGEGWSRTRLVPRRALSEFPDVSFSDRRIRWADFTGDGLTDIAMINDGHVDYWPSLGHGDWGPRVSMGNGPRFPWGYDHGRILLGDVDGDGLADLVYVDDGRVTLWLNRSGNAWSEPIAIRGTPPVAGSDLRLVDVLGTGIAGVLWSRDPTSAGSVSLSFLDFTGGRKPYLLAEKNNHAGALTHVEYAPSTRYYAEDERQRSTRWQTSLPFPVHVVAKVEVNDHFSGGTLTSEYRYRHGHWDGGEREFRGFGLVEQRDAELFDQAGAAPSRRAPPTINRTWFHVGPVGDEHGDWAALDLAGEYWPGDPNMLSDVALPAPAATPEARRVLRDAVRALRGSVLRTELYAPDGTDRADRPYHVGEKTYAVDALEPTAPERSGVFFARRVEARTTSWERGDDPLTVLYLHRPPRSVRRVGSVRPAPRRDLPGVPARLAEAGRSPARALSRDARPDRVRPSRRPGHIHPRPCLRHHLVRDHGHER